VNVINEDELVRRTDSARIIVEKKLKLVKEINYLYSELDKPIGRNVSDYLDALDFRIQWLSRTSQILADAEILYDAAKGEASEEFIGTRDGWIIVKGLIEAKVSEEKRLFRQADRLNSTVVHSIDAIRSMLSSEKADRIASSYNNTIQGRR
jgi:hypothetical protein